MAATHALGVELKDTRKLLTGEKLLEAIDENSLDSLGSMLSLRSNDLDLVGSGRRSRPALFECTQFIVCKNRECKYIIPYNMDTCPYCKTPQEQIGKEPTMEDDLDKDGIPDLVEKASLTLNYRYPWDSCMDFDGDGFLNIEEYRAGTDMEDGFSVPEFAYMLRVKGAPSKLDLPFKLSKVKDSGGSTDVTEWKGTFNVGGKNIDVKMGGEIGRTGYTLIGFAADKTSANIQDAAGNDYTLALGVKTSESSYSIDFVYMTGHLRGVRPLAKSPKQVMVPETDEERAKRLKAAAARMGGGMGGGMGGASANASGQMPIAFTLHEGDKFFLEYTPSGTVVRAGGDGGMGMGASTVASGEEERKLEYYQVLPVEEVEVAVAEESDDTEDGENEAEVKKADEAATETRLVVRVQRLTSLEDGEPVGKPIEINVLDTSRTSHDYLYNSSGMGGGADGMGMGGMGMGGGLR